MKYHYREIGVWEQEHHLPQDLLELLLLHWSEVLAILLHLGRVIRQIHFDD